MSKQHIQYQCNKNSFVSTAYSNMRSRSRKFIKQSNQTCINENVAKAKLLYNSGSLTQALALFQQVMPQLLNSKIVDKTTYLDVHYLSATICMATNEYGKAEKYFKKVIKEANNYKGNTFLLLAISLNKVKKYEQSLLYLDQVCDKLKSTDGLVYRGRLRLKNMQYEQAIEDFSKLVNRIDGNNQQAKLYLYQAQFYANYDHKDLINKLNHLLTQLIHSKIHNESLRKCRNLFANVLLLQGKVEDAVNYINKNLQQFNRDSQTLYIKSKICSIQGKADEQLLLLNECITIKDHKKSTAQALQSLIVLALKQKDFYEAFEYSKRNQYLKIQNKSTLSLFKIAEALTFLMKKKYGEGLLILGAINAQSFKPLKENYKFLRNLLYNGLGYTYFSLGQHKQALEMYKQIQIANTVDDNIYLYNIRLCEGILLIKNGKMQQAIKTFEACTDHLMRAEPYFYISVILIQKNLNDNSDPQIFSRVISIIDSGLKVSDNYQMYYYRALMYLYLGMNAAALEDVDRAIQKSEDNVAAFFYLRALIFFLQRNYQSAIAELSTCISIDDKYFQAYLQRAKLRLLNDQPQQAYSDLQNYPMNEEWRPLFLLYHHKFQTILQQSNGVGHMAQIANFHLGKYQKGGSAGKVMLAVINQNYQQVISLLQDALQINYQIGCFDLSDIYLIKSFCNFKISMYDQSVCMLNKSQELLKSNQLISTFGEEDEKKLLAIKMNLIFVSLKSQGVSKSLQKCEKLINQVYQGAVHDELTKIRRHLQKVLNKEQIQTNIQLFKTTPMLSDYLGQQNIHGLKFRFIIPFPKIYVAEIQSVPYLQPLIEFNVSNIDNRAQAPWIRKDEHGIIFTNKIQIFENLKLYTEMEQNNQEQYNKSSKEKLKQQLLKDAEMLNKLQKLNKVVKPTKSNTSVA